MGLNGLCASREINAIPSLKSLGHWLGLQTMARDRCVSDTELPVKKILFNAGRKGSSTLLPLVILVWGNY